MQQRIAIVSGTHLCRNPRVVKEGAALARAGFEVIVISSQWNASLKREDKRVAALSGFEHRVPFDLSEGGIANFARRISSRAGREAVRLTGMQSRSALGYGITALGQAALAAQADLTIGHQEVGLVVACQLGARGLKTGVDMEDWYSEDLLENARKYRPLKLLRQMEAQALSGMTHCTTTSEAMAAAMAMYYGCRSPVCIYNAFEPVSPTTMQDISVDRRFPDRPSLYWVSQTIGPGRGLEELMSALTRVDQPLELCLRGNVDPNYKRSLLRMLGGASSHQVTFLDLVPAEELGVHSAQHDIGLALEESEPRSRDLTITNKLFHGLQAGLAVVATRTAGQEEAARIANGGVRLVEHNSAAALAQAIASLAASPKDLEDAKSASRKAARGDLGWFASERRLLDSIQVALQA